jgi:flagellar hook-length control protein FliK
VDFTSLFNGPAQAGSSALVGAAAVAAAGGGTAGPAPAGAGADSDFASLVALALGQLGTPAAADGEAEPIAGRSKRRPAGAPGPAAEPIDGEAPAEASAEAPEAATLSVLLALAVPPQPVVAPIPVDVPAATDDHVPASAAPVDGRMAVAEPTVPMAAPAAAASPAPVQNAPVGAATVVATGPTFADALSVAGPAQTNAADAPAEPVGDAPTVQAAIPYDGRPTSAVGVAETKTLAAPAPALQASAASEPVSAPPQTGAPSAPPQARPEGAAPAGPSPRPAVAPGRELRGAAQQIRDILAAGREAAGREAPGREAAVPASPATPAATPAVVNGPLANGVQAHASGTPAQESAPAVGRPAVVSAAAGIVAPSRPVAEGRSDADASGERGADAGPLPASAVAARTAPALDLRFDPVASTPGAAPAPLPVAPIAALPVVVSPLAADDALRAIELPASARLEQALASLDPETRNLQSIVRTVRLFTAGDGLSEARLQLEPDHLGPVGLTVRVEQGSVSAHFRAETPAAQRWIETHQQELRAGLREQGLEVKDVVVTTDPDGRRDRRQEAPQARPARLRRSATLDADAPRFEVLV